MWARSPSTSSTSSPWLPARPCSSRPIYLTPTCLEVRRQFVVRVIVKWCCHCRQACVDAQSTSRLPVWRFVVRVIVKWCCHFRQARIDAQPNSRLLIWRFGFKFQVLTHNLTLACLSGDLGLNFREDNNEINSF